MVMQNWKMSRSSSSFFFFLGGVCVCVCVCVCLFSLFSFRCLFNRWLIVRLTCFPLSFPRDKQTIHTSSELVGYQRSINPFVPGKGTGGAHSSASASRSTTGTRVLHTNIMRPSVV